MESEQESPRPLLTPGEILQLPGDDALLIVGGIPPYRAKKVMYYQDDRFRDRAWLPAPDSEQEQRAELFKSRVWENAWEVQANGLGHDRFADAESGDCTTISDQDNGGLKPSITKIPEASLLEPDVCDDQHDFDDFDEFLRYEEANGAPNLNTERQQSCHEERQEDEAVGMNRKLELTRTPDGGRLPL
jgi:type IV secretion system protein VirD4